ncbi:MAG: GH116 family glycosyl hydrolase, partial [Candidatus Bathyarchaeia archaeon]
EFAWKYWDSDKNGVMEGMQHNTYDIEFYGPNTMTGSLYLGALRAAEEMARHVGEDDKTREYYELFQNGSKWSDEHLFNGEYYEQKVNPTAHEMWPDPYRQLALRHGKDDKFEDWPKWQFGKGCLSDQLIGQWYSHMLGLGYLYSPQNVRRALESIFRYNWKPTLQDHPCLFRIYALNDETGLIAGTWPKGERPGHAFYFADEVWCGIEYQVAAHMIYEGMIEEGLAVVMGTRRRHRGDRRNPWDEFECGHHYARSMASYSLLLALSGFGYSAPEKRLRFSPTIFQHDFRTFFSVASGWGLYTQKIHKDKAEFSITIKYGRLALNRLELPPIDVEKPRVVVTLDGERIDAEVRREKESTVVTLDSLVINQHETLRISISL